MSQLSRRLFLSGVSCLPLQGIMKATAMPAMPVDGERKVPEWALLQRQLLDEMSDACVLFYNKYFDERGYFLCYERWGANDGPDDAIENLNNWPQLHALGGKEVVKDLYTHGWEGHLRQFTQAKTSQIEIARDGMLYKEFNVQFDWQHLAEELTVFNVMPASDPYNQANTKRIRRFAGLYMGEDEAAQNWDPKHKIIKSMMNGSRGPMLRDATALDWAGEYFEVGDRFFMEHGETTYEETLDHYREYTEVVGDHPLNLLSTTLALNAFMLTQEPKYKKWLLEYVDAWAERAEKNDGILPSNIGLDGEIGSAANGKWYGGTYGWGFSPIDTTTGERVNRNRVLRTIVGFFNAYLLTGEDKYLQTWRRLLDEINAQKRTQNGILQTPTQYGDDGWYGWKDGLNESNRLDIWWFSMKKSDRKLAPDHPWIAFLEGRNEAWPVQALRQDISQVVRCVDSIHEDTSTPDTRLADGVLKSNPATITALMHQTMGAIHIGRPAWSKSSAYIGGSPLYARVRHFDPERKRAGLPEDMAALVTEMTDDMTALTIVNTGMVFDRDIVIQGGGYGEHQINSITVNGESKKVDQSYLRLKVPAHSSITIQMQMSRYKNSPTLLFPWDR